MNGHFAAAIVWSVIVAAGYAVIQHYAAPEPVVRMAENGSRTVIIPVAPDGHYYVEGRINGHALTFLVDTGASYVSVDERFARNADIKGDLVAVFETANGQVEGRLARGQSVSADMFEIDGLTVAVMPGGHSHGLLGQNFLRHFSVSQSNGHFVIRVRQL